MALSVIFGIFVLRLRHDQKFQPIKVKVEILTKIYRKVWNHGTKRNSKENVGNV